MGVDDAHATLRRGSEAGLMARLGYDTSDARRVGFVHLQSGSFEPTAFRRRKQKRNGVGGMNLEHLRVEKRFEKLRQTVYTEGGGRERPAPRARSHNGWQTTVHKAYLSQRHENYTQQTKVSLRDQLAQQLAQDFGVPKSKPKNNQLAERQAEREAEKKKIKQQHRQRKCLVVLTPDNWKKWVNELRQLDAYQRHLIENTEGDIKQALALNDQFKVQVQKLSLRVAKLDKILYGWEDKMDMYPSLFGYAENKRIGRLLKQVKSDLLRQHSTLGVDVSPLTERTCRRRDSLSGAGLH
jgi:hypothetical protein